MLRKLTIGRPPEEVGNGRPDGLCLRSWHEGSELPAGTRAQQQTMPRLEGRKLLPIFILIIRKERADPRWGQPLAPKGHVFQGATALSVKETQTVPLPRLRDDPGKRTGAAAGQPRQI